MNHSFYILDGGRRPECRRELKGCSVVFVTCRRHPSYSYDSYMSHSLARGSVDGMLLERVGHSVHGPCPSESEGAHLGAMIL